MPSTSTALESWKMFDIIRRFDRKKPVDAQVNTPKHTNKNPKIENFLI